MAKPKKSSKAKRQKLSSLTLEDLPNELITRTFRGLNMKDLINCGQVSKRFRTIFSDEQGRRKEDLLKIIQDLQCITCKKVPGPIKDKGRDAGERPGDRKNKRFLCEKSSHSRCGNHWYEDFCNDFNKNCPCGSLLDKEPSESIAKKLQFLPWMCQNYKRGCREVKMDVNNLKIHHGKCIFRKVFCPHPDCSKFNRVDRCHIPSWRCRRACHWGKRVCFKDIFDHFNSKHKKVWPQINGESNKWTDSIDRIFPDFSNGYSWYSGKMTSTDDDVFAVFARIQR